MPATVRYFEGKIATDKTWGHAAYGCMICCGYHYGTLVPVPIDTPVGGIRNVEVESTDDCTFLSEFITGYYDQWWTASSSIATASFAQYQGVAAGSTTGYARGYIPRGSGGAGGNQSCPTLLSTTSGGVGIFDATLSCSPTNVTRAQNVSCSVQLVNVPTGATVSYSEWKFTGSATVTRQTNVNQASWAGKLVLGGTVSVKVTVNTSAGQTIKTPSAQVQVTPRAGFAFAAVSPVKRSNPFTHPGNCSMSIPTSPAAGNQVGYSCLDQYFSTTHLQVSDNGPNHGYWYVQSVSNSHTLPTTFDFVVAGYADSAITEFAQKQCGNYHAQNNPTGFISFSQLHANITQHESGLITGHYAQYKSMQDVAANNLGAVLEQETAVPGTSAQTFDNQVTSLASAKGSAIASATASEACNQDVRNDTTCTFRGNINWPTYTPCP